MKYYILKAKETDVFKNLAYEFSVFTTLEQIFLNTKENFCALFLWQNDNTIVIGRNQNIFKECNLEFCKSNNISIARRKTGGGAVFHDLGNLNFSFFSSKNVHNLSNNYSIIQNALQSFNVNATQTGRNDLTIGERKFSGSAFYNTKNASLHHGTILINTPSSLITGALTPSKLKLKTHCVDSVKSRIVNLSELNTSITPETFSKSLIESFKKFYNIQTALTSIDINENTLLTNYTELSSSKWIQNTKSPSNLELSQHFDWGEIQLQLLIENELIDNCNVYTDSLAINLSDNLKFCLTKAPLNKNEFKEHCKKYLQNCEDEEIKSILNDIFPLFDKILN